MKKILVLVVMAVMVLIGGYGYADVVTANASPAIVEVSAANPTQEVTFPVRIRNLSIFNYDSSDGLWINLRGGDTNGPGVVANRFYLGPSGELILNDFETNAITCVYDNGYFTIGTASPVSVIATY